VVATPWGDSEQLRERRLRPVRGTPPDEVERNQRERLFGALVASCAEKGYAGTTVADLVEISGVSSRSFYALFGDRHNLARATLEDILDRLQGPLSASTEPIDEERSRERFECFAAAVAEQPATARFVLAEAFGAGPEAVAALEHTIGRFEEEVRKRYEATAALAGVHSQVITARLGGILELARARLRAGREAELVGLGAEIVAVAIADRAPPESLRFGVRPKRGVQESLEVTDHAERAMRAFAVMVAERGYAETTVEDVVRRAGMSARTFYANFSGKEDLMASAIESACAQAIAVTMPAFARHAEWPLAVRAGFGALFNFLASRPALAALLTVGVYEAGDKALEARLRGLAPLASLMENRTSSWDRQGWLERNLTGGGLFWLTYTQVRRNGPESLPGLAPICTYLLLSPLLGPEEACAAANNQGGGRQSTPQDRFHGSNLSVETELVQTIEVLSARDASAAELTAATGFPLETVEEQLRHLSAADLARPVEEWDDEGGRRYRMERLRFVVDTEALSLEARKTLSADFRRAARADEDLSVGSGTFDARGDQHFSRTPIRVDEEGWRELREIHDKALYASFAIASRAKSRLKETGERGRDTRSIHILFEMPLPDEEAEGDARENGE
jgi:AcrR family transcriptional regulator